MYGSDVDVLATLDDLSTSEIRQRFEHRGFDPGDYENLLAHREDTYSAMRIATLLGMVKD